MTEALWLSLMHECYLNLADITYKSSIAEEILKLFQKIYGKFKVFARKDETQTHP